MNIQAKIAHSLAEFNRKDIKAAHFMLEIDYNISGVLQERKSNQRRRMSTGFQLWRMQFKPSPMLSYNTLSDNGKAIYDALVIEYGLPEPNNF